MTSKNKIIERKTCRISGEKLVPIFSLGNLYMSDFIKKKSNPKLGRVPLNLCLAPKSGLVQLSHTPPFDEMYRKYWYRSGTNKTMTEELRNIADSATKLIKPQKGDVWVDIASNDGTLLSFVDKNIYKVGFDPSDIAKKEGSKKLNYFVNNYFNIEDYKKGPRGRDKAKVVTSIAMFYDLENPHEFVKEVKEVLEDDGLWVAQMSYLPLMLEQLAFDNICHEHLEYYSLTSLKYLLDQHGLEIVDTELNDINGGSFRVYIMKNEADKTKFASAPYRDVANFRIMSILNYEKKLKLNSVETYKKFFKKISGLREKTVDFIKKEKAKGKIIWGYGASTKGNTLLQWYGLNNDLIDGIAERSPAKYGLKTAGTNIPIESEEKMRKAKPDYLLVLPWHFISEFVEREKDFLRSGGKFILPCPNFEVISFNENKKNGS